MKKFISTLLLLLTLSILQAKERPMNIYDFEVLDIKGNKVSLSKYKDKTLLIVNVASKCKFTPQYKELEELYQKYKDKNFMILGFPSNEFRKQEPASNSKIELFCTSTYDVHFDMFAKTVVNGENTIPFYKFLKNEKKGIFWTESIKWNFTKFLVNKDGKVLQRYAPITSPSDIESDIVKLLN